MPGMLHIMHVAFPSHTHPSPDRGEKLDDISSFTKQNSRKHTSERRPTLYLEVVGNEKGGGVKKQATVRIWFRTMAIDVCLILNVAVVFSSTYFRFLFVKLS
jgi:hypothetical protein